MESKLTGTAALVTGASSGIGAATVRRLAEHGACVALIARRRDRLEALAAEIDKAGGTALAVEADITDRAQAEAAVQQAVERFGRLDTLVNNAGLMLLGPVVGTDAAEWDRMITINVQGLLYTTRAALPHLLQAAEGGGALDHAVHQRCSTVHGESQARTARSARGRGGAGGGTAAREPPLSAAGFRLRRRSLAWRGVVTEPGGPAEGERAVDQDLVAADGEVGADLEVGPAQLVLDLLAALLDGLITNDKFCCVRRLQLSLTWWRRPLRLRASVLQIDVASSGEPDDPDPDVDRLPPARPEPRRRAPLGSGLSAAGALGVPGRGVLPDADHRGGA